MTFPNPPATVKSVTIAEDGDTSSAVDLEHYTIVGIIWPEMTGATCTFLVSATGDGTYVELVDESGAAISITATDSKATGLDSSLRELAPWRFMKLVSASAEAAEREIQLVLKA